MKKLLCLLFAFTVIFSAAVMCRGDEFKIPRLIDESEVIPDADEAVLLQRMNELSEKYEFDLVIMTVDSESMAGISVEDFANDTFLYCGFGYGENKDGMLLLMVMDTRDWAVSKNGFALEAFTDAGFDYIIEQIKSDLGEDNFTGAFTDYVDLCDDFLAKAKAGEPYTEDTLPKEPFSAVSSLIVSVIIGFVIALIATGVMKGQLKSVRFRSEASDYTKPGSMQVNESRDFFLYSTVSRTEKKQDDDSDRSSGGGSSRNQSGKF